MCCEGPTTCCPCYDLPSYLYASAGGDPFELSLTSCEEETGAEYTDTETIGTFHACNDDWLAARLFCEGGAWTIRFQTSVGGTPDITVPLSWDGDCQNLVLAGSHNGCNVTVTP